MSTQAIVVRDSAALTSTPVISSFSFLADVLPDELVYLILSNLKGADTVRASLTCRRLYQIGNDHLLWKLHFFNEYPRRALAPVSPLAMLPWKGQYRYAMTVQSNLIRGIHTGPLLNGHTQRITCMKGEGRDLLTGSSDGQVKSWRKNEVGAYAELQEFNDCNDGIFELSSDQNQLIYKSNDGIKFLRREPVGGLFELLQTLPGDGSKISQLKIEGDHILSRSENGNFSIWKQDELGVFQPSAPLANVSHFNIKGDLLFLRFTDGTTRIWNKDDTGTFAESYMIVESTPSLESVSSLSCEGAHLVMADANGAIKIFRKDRAERFQEVQTLEGANLYDPATTIVVKDDYIFVGCLRGSVRIFKRADNGQYDLIQSIAEHNERINSMMFRDDYLFIGSTDASAGIWEKENRGTFRRIQTLNGIDEGVTCVKMDNDRFYTAYGNGSVKIWDFSTPV